MENHVSRGRDTGHNRNFRMNSGQNRQFRQAGGLQTGAPIAAAHMQNSDRNRSFRDAAADHSAGKKILYIAENSSFFLQRENHASRKSRGSGRNQSEYPHHNRNFRQNSGQNRQRRETGGPQPAAPTAAAHVQNSGRGRSFRDPATPHSAAPRGNGGDGGTSSGDSGRGGRGGAHYVARQPSSELVGTTTAIATSGRANRAAINSSITFRGSSTTSVTPIPGAPNQYGWSHHCSALFSWRMGSVVGGIQCLLATAVSIIIIFFFFVRFNEIRNFLEVYDDLKNLMNFG